MSVDAMKWAWRADCTSAAEKLVLMALADNADNDGYCWPGNAKTAERCQMSVASVRRHILALERTGLIVKVRRKRRGDGTLSVWIYRLSMDEHPESTSAQTEPVDTYEQKSAHIRAKNCAPVSAQEPSCEPSENPQLSHVSDIVHEAEIVPEWEITFRAWWKQYPRKLGKQHAVKAWRKLTDTERTEALDALPAHIRHWRTGKTAVEYIPHPATWLNGRRWEDELDTDYQPEGGLLDAAVRYALQQQRQERTDGHRAGNGGTRQIGRGDDRLE